MSRHFLPMRVPGPGATGPSEETRAALHERAGSLARFGYRPADAEFLVAAALLGSHFVRRQHLYYVGCRAGGTDTKFLRLVESNGHAVPVVGKQLYRLRGASLCRAIRCNDGFARRATAWAAIKKSLLAIDYFLEAKIGGGWLLSEADKAAYFESLGVPAETFPLSPRSRGGRPRIFPDGFPITTASGKSPVVSFSYAHSGSTHQAMLRHLTLYEPLVAALAHRGLASECVVLADSPMQFARLRHAWRLWRDNAARNWVEREYFALRLDVDKRNWSGLSRDSVERYARLSAECSGRSVEARYREWLASGSPPRQPGGDFSESCKYREVLLERDYAIADRAVR